MVIKPMTEAEIDKLERKFSKMSRATANEMAGVSKKSNKTSSKKKVSKKK